MNVRPKKYNRLNSYEEFVDYCLKRLGAPVLNIEVEDSQLIDRISDAIQFYLEMDLESVQEFWWLHKISKKDVESGYIQLTPDVLDLLEILSGKKGNSGIYDFGVLDDPEYQWFNNFWNRGNVFTDQSMFYYEVSMQYISLLRNMFQAPIQFSYRPRERKIFLYKEEIEEGRVICLHGNKVLDPENDDCIWDSAFLKEYATALIGVQWGNNISKFQNVPSAAGITLDGTSILQRYTEEKTRLEEKHKLMYEEPPMFFWG